MPGLLGHELVPVLVSEDLELLAMLRVQTSNGCIMAQRMALEASDLVAAVGCVAGYLMWGADDFRASCDCMYGALVWVAGDLRVPFGRSSVGLE